MEDLAWCLLGGHFYLVAPKAREREVVAQMTRLVFQESVSRAFLAYVAFDDIHENCDALCRFGGHPGVMRKLARFRPSPNDTDP
jgi:type II restriction enzyme